MLIQHCDQCGKETKETYFIMVETYQTQVGKNVCADCFSYLHTEQQTKNENLILG